MEVCFRNLGWLLKLAVVAFLLACCLSTPGFSQLYTNPHPAPDFGRGDVWLDQDASVPHHIRDYHGQVVLVDFWEYTCINCIRDFAVVKRWYGKYHAYGFEVIGVHYGEFNIGFSVDNVRAAAQRFRLPWPIVADQDGSAWKAYVSQGWPNRYVIDQNGMIVMQVFGEGNNRQMESKIRELLAVTHPEVMKVDLDPEENELRPECGNSTEETFVGYLHGRTSVEDMAGHHVGDVTDFEPPHSPPDGSVMLVGHWRVDPDGMEAEKSGAGAEVRYHARSLYAVLGVRGPKSIRVDLFQDGNPLPKNNAGADVRFDSDGAYIEVSEPRMYYLVRSPSFSAHLIALQAKGAGVELYSFTYGNNCQLTDQP